MESKLALAVIVIVVLLTQSIILFRSSLRSRSGRQVALAEVFRNQAHTGQCFIADDGRGIRVANSSIHGNGVFAARRFEAGALIETCPLVIMPPDNWLAMVYTLCSRIQWQRYRAGAWIRQFV